MPEDSLNTCEPFTFMGYQKDQLTLQKYMTRKYRSIMNKRSKILISLSAIALMITFIHNPKRSPSNQIPKLLMQTFHSPLPTRVKENICKFAPNYRHIFFNNQEAELFLLKHFPLNVTSRFQNLTQGAHKADLFRYCWLYINGGVYLDVDVGILSSS